MKDKRVKTIITNWVIPFLSLLVTLGALLLHFSVTSRTKEFEEVQDYLRDTVEDCAREFENIISSLMVASEPVGSLMENYASEDVDIAINVTQALVDNTDAYMAVMCNVAGEGMTQTGERVSLSDESYYMQAAGVSAKYTYSDDDGIEGRRCIIAVLPLSKGQEVKGYLFAYYDVSGFEALVSAKEFDSSVYYSVIDQEGASICEEGVAYAIFNPENIWEGILANAVNIEEVQEAKKLYDDNESGIVKVELEGSTKDKLVVWTPTGIDNWDFVMAMNYSYVDSLMAKEWEGNRGMLIRIVVCILVFAGVTIVSLAITKIRENEKNKDLSNKADTDLLTSLYNKAATERKIREYLQQHSDEQALLFVLDIDNFKKINDTMGHAFGDEVLRSLGHQIQAYFRVTDIIGRTGGDEFMIFLKGMKDDETILKEARKLEYFFKNFQTGEYVKYSATASIGAAVFPRDASDFDGLYKVADKALYTAKQRGKNQLAFYNEEPFKKGKEQ